jgi:hypothetical protein
VNPLTLRQESRHEKAGPKGHARLGRKTMHLRLDLPPRRFTISSIKRSRHLSKPGSPRTHWKKHHETRQSFPTPDGSNDRLAAIATRGGGPVPLCHPRIHGTGKVTKFDGVEFEIKANPRNFAVVTLNAADGKPIAGLLNEGRHDLSTTGWRRFQMENLSRMNPWFSMIGRMRPAFSCQAFSLLRISVSIPFHRNLP